ncbi:MAG: acyl carrier protein [Patescibacteria group bacterium]
MDTLKKIFSSILGIAPDQITGELSPQNTPSWDSLNAIVLITEIEKAFKVRFGFNEAMAVKNFADVVELVKSKTIDFHE